MQNENCRLEPPMLVASIETSRRPTQVILRKTDVILKGNWEACDQNPV